MVFRLKIIDFGAKFGQNYKHGSTNHPFRTIKMDHVFEASGAYPYQKFWEVTSPPAPGPGNTIVKCPLPGHKERD